ncbi:MAG: hypothetical protein EOP59_02325 [Sphingomonadales bacterium]|nr:MAG: hypothetical protein EOP59_02325 [Sphingomonadales bacterium]
MPSYHFITTDHDTARSEEVVDLPDNSAARKAATDYIGELVRELDGKLFNHALELRVIDEQNELLFLVTVMASETQAART